MTPTKHTHTVEEVEAFMSQFVCADGQKLAKNSDVYGMTVHDAIVRLRAMGLREDAAWLKTVRQSEAYVRWNGKEFRMGENYQIFNPITGQHVVCKTLDAAQALTKQIIEHMVGQHRITACKELINEKGDAAWIPVDFVYETSVEVKIST